jgi:hypothetical protein
LNEQEHLCTREKLRHVRKDRRRAKRALHITAAITGDVTEIEETLKPKTQDALKSDQTERRPDANAEKTQQRTPGVPKSSQPEWRPGEKSGKTRWLPWQHRTPSWQAAYNAACLYAALACSDEACSDEDRQSKMAQMAVRCLRRAVNDRNCEMERPWDWISTDPDLRSLRCCSPDFSEFLAEQKQKDYPDADPDSDQNWHWVRCDGGRTCEPAATEPGNSQPQQAPTLSRPRRGSPRAQRFRRS